jgi:hypothetical protein
MIGKAKLASGNRDFTLTKVNGTSVVGWIVVASDVEMMRQVSV